MADFPVSAHHASIARDKSRVLLLSLVIVAFSIWVAFRLVENAVAAAWKISGVIASRLMRKPAEAHSAEQKGIGE